MIASPQLTRGRACEKRTIMGLLISDVFLIVLECGLMGIQLVGVILFLLSLTSFVRHFATARRRKIGGGLPEVTPWTPYALGGIGIFFLVPASVALFTGKWLGVFDTWVV
ncbi:hypothetical protein ACWDA7_06460 [Streptomyces sp. NPDC001156]|jgi:hypothetical protein